MRLDTTNLVQLRDLMTLESTLQSSDTSGRNLGATSSSSQTSDREILKHYFEISKKAGEIHQMIQRGKNDDSFLVPPVTVTVSSALVMHCLFDSVLKV